MFVGCALRARAPKKLALTQLLQWATHRRDRNVMTAVLKLRFHVGDCLRLLELNENGGSSLLVEHVLGLTVRCDSFPRAENFKHLEVEKQKQRENEEEEKEK